MVIDCAHGRPWREAAAVLAQKFNIHITYRTVGYIVTRWERSHTLERKKGTGRLGSLPQGTNACCATWLVLRGVPQPQNWCIKEPLL